jgi:hypothetical protein
MSKKIQLLETKLAKMTEIWVELPSFEETQSHPDLDVKSIDFAATEKTSDAEDKNIVDLGIGNFTYDSKNSNFNYDLGNFEPVDT